MRFKLLEELVITEYKTRDKYGELLVPQIVNKKSDESEEVIIDGQEIDKQIRELLNNLTPASFEKYVDIQSQDNLQDKGPAFIDIKGQYYHLIDAGWEEHRDIRLSIIKGYIQKELSNKGIDEQLIDTFYHKFMWYSDILFDYNLDYITRKASLVRINTGSRASDNRFYMVVLNELTKYQQYAIEEFLEFGFNNNRNRVLIFCGKDDNNIKDKTYSLSEYSPKDIIQRINRCFTNGELLENNNNFLNEEVLNNKTYIFRGESNNKYQWNYHNRSKDDLNSRYYSWEAFNGISEFGNVVVYELLDESNILDYGDSSAQFCIDYDLMEKRYPLLYKRYGVHCLEEIDNKEFNTERPTVKLNLHDAYHAYQLVATIYLEKETNYSGCIWYEWIDTPEEQIQIWDNSIVRKLSYQEAKQVCTELAKINPDVYKFGNKSVLDNNFNLHR